MRTLMLVIVLALGVVFLTGCVQSSDNAASTNPSDIGSAQGAGSPQDRGAPAYALPFYTLSEVATHHAPDDCWLALNGSVYNLSTLEPNRSGSNASAPVASFCGTDATENLSALMASAYAGGVGNGTFNRSMMGNRSDSENFSDGFENRTPFGSGNRSGFNRSGYGMNRTGRMGGGMRLPGLTLIGRLSG